MVIPVAGLCGTKNRDSIEVTAVLQGGGACLKTFIILGQEVNKHIVIHSWFYIMSFS